MTPLESAKALVEMAEKATRAPWGHGRDPSHYDAPEIIKNDGAFYIGTRIEDAAFIAAARNTAPAIASALVEACKLLRHFNKEIGARNSMGDVVDEYAMSEADMRRAARAFLARMEPQESGEAQQ